MFLYTWTPQECSHCNKKYNAMANFIHCCTFTKISASKSLFSSNLPSEPGRCLRPGFSVLYPESDEITGQCHSGYLTNTTTKTLTVFYATRVAVTCLQWHLLHSHQFSPPSPVPTPPDHVTSDITPLLPITGSQFPHSRHSEFWTGCKIT